MNSYPDGSTCSPAYLNRLSPRNQIFVNSLDLCRDSVGPSHLQRIIVAVSGLIMLTVGPCVFLLNIDNQGWTWAFALIMTWIGLTLLLVLSHSSCRNSEPCEEEKTWKKNFTNTDDISHALPMVEALAGLGRQTKSCSVVLLSFEEYLWCPRIGWNCSQHFGQSVANLLESTVPTEAQSMQVLSLMDRQLKAFYTPIHMRSGRPLLLVLINEINQPIHYKTASLALKASLKISVWFASQKLRQAMRY
jgi:hypothetical protein